LLSGAPARAQNKPPEPPAVKEQEPPEEDPDLIPREYSFNPLEASRNITAGNFYFKKGNYRAASRRYSEASKWDPSSGEALLKLAEADETMRDFAGAREAYTKYLAMPDAKDADAVKKRLAKLPQARTKK
jgi:tetratricopeptide (TPR) repeat protein